MLCIIEPCRTRCVLQSSSSTTTTPPPPPPPPSQPGESDELMLWPPASRERHESRLRGPISRALLQILIKSPGRPTFTGSPRKPTGLFPTLQYRTMTTLGDRDERCVELRINRENRWPTPVRWMFTRETELCSSCLSMKCNTKGAISPPDVTNIPLEIPFQLRISKYRNGEH